jgi:hypothetical protein
MFHKSSTSIDYLIELINRATPDSLNIAQSILKNYEEIKINQLAMLQELVKLSLADRSNLTQSTQVRVLKQEIIDALVANTKELA